jgi:hypothetical protein
MTPSSSLRGTVAILLLACVSMQATRPQKHLAQKGLGACEEIRVAPLHLAWVS